MAVQPGLYRTWSETSNTGFLTTRLKCEREMAMHLNSKAHLRHCLMIKSTLAVLELEFIIMFMKYYALQQMFKHKNGQISKVQFQASSFKAFQDTCISLAKLQCPNFRKRARTPVKSLNMSCCFLTKLSQEGRLTSQWSPNSIHC